MEHFLVSARKYRPQTFEEVVGQGAITRTLENAIENNHLAQALLFTGPRGIGKTTCARILAKRINQDTDETLSEDEDFAFNIFELDAASNNSVEDIRNLTDQIRIPPQVGKYKIYIIDEVHMLSQSAFNAFLKTLEEPPPHAIFILATTEKHKIIPTILSRCQIFDFKRIGVKDIKKYLHTVAQKENIRADDDALHIIAQKADGALRDALSIFDRVVSFSGNELTRQAVTENLNVLDYDAYFKTVELLLANDIPSVLVHFNAILNKGFYGQHFIAGLASHFRDLLVSKDKATIALLEVGDTAKKRYLEQSEKTSVNFLLEAIDISNDCDFKYKSSKNQRLFVELTLMQLASLTKTDKKKTKYIIPPTFFKAKPKTSSSVVEEPKVAYQEAEKKEEQPQNTELLPTTKEVSSQPPIPRKRPSSVLSINSLHNKTTKEKKKEAPIDSQELPQRTFSEADFYVYWKKYIDILNKQGNKILASMLNSSEPQLKGTEVSLTYPNAMMLEEVKKQQLHVLNYLREKLQNYRIHFHLILDETQEKAFVYTAEEKYAKLREINPLIEEFRRTLHLDIKHI